MKQGHRGGDRAVGCAVLTQGNAMEERKEELYIVKKGVGPMRVRKRLARPKKVRENAKSTPQAHNEGQGLT